MFVYSDLVSSYFSQFWSEFLAMYPETETFETKFEPFVSKTIALAKKLGYDFPCSDGELSSIADSIASYLFHYTDHCVLAVYRLAQSLITLFPTSSGHTKDQEGPIRDHGGELHLLS